MSGQCGMVRWDGAGVESSWIATMIEAARWRGVDGVRQEVFRQVGFGYLSHEVTPESVGEQQPLVHGGTGIMVSADVRLDNREELSTQGGAGDSDAQLLLASYLRWGSECAERLLGDFAWVVWDPREQRVYLCRDAMGMRPLYYRVEPNRVIWASEVKQILAVPGVERRLNETAIATHLSGSYLPLGMSFYEGIAQVPPGEIVAVDAERVSSRRYWQVDPNRRIRYRREQEYAEHFRELFQRAVESRLRSVKPVGISLSGGMDSGSVASMAGWMYEQGVSRYTPEFRSYSWAFDELVQCDERAVSRLITDRYRIPAVDIPGDDAWPLRDYPLHGPDVDEPYLLYYDELMNDLLARAASSGVGLLLTGERGDATVGGLVYDYPGLALSMRLTALLREVWAHGSALGKPLIPAMKSLVVRPLARSLLRRGVGESAPLTHQPPAYLNVGDSRMPELQGVRLAATEPVTIADEARRSRHQLIFSAMSARRVQLLNRQQARFGIDYADPWSDRRLAEFVIAIPQHIVHRFCDSKRLVRNALGDVLCDPLRGSSSTMAKADPTPLYNRGVYERARVAAEDLIDGSLAAALGFVTKSTLQADYRNRLDGTALRYDIWWFLTAEMWLRAHFADLRER